MPPHVITRPGSWAVPYSIDLGATDELTPSSVFAHFNGAAASGAFLPCVTYYTQDGLVFARAFPDDDVAAGASADVSWFPGLSTSPAGSSTASAIIGTRVFKTASQSIPTSVSTQVLVDSVQHDSGGWFDAANHRLNLPSAGWYIVGGSVGWTSPVAAAIYSASIVASPASVILLDGVEPASTFSFTHTFSAPYYFSAAGTVSLFVQQLSGGSVSIAGSQLTALWAVAVA